MAFNPPNAQPSSKGGMMFVNPPGLANYRALRVESGDQHLYWQPTYQHLLRVEGAFGEFFPQAEFSEGGDQVIFTKYVDKVEVMSQTRALRPGEKIPRAEWIRFLETWANFKRLADRSDIPEDVRSFIHKFGPPSVERYPAAYRIYRPNWYSKPRLFVLWGLEPVGGAEFLSITPEQAITEGTARAETDAEESGYNFLHWLKVLLICLLLLASALFLVWCCLPRPVVDFKVKAEAGNQAEVSNLTTIDRSLDWGDQAFHWSFAGGLPDSSAEFEPKPVWHLAGQHEVILEATQSTLWGLLYKSESKTSTITVTEPPKPPATVPPLSNEGSTSPGAPKPDGKPAPAPGVPGPSDKMPHENKTLPGAPKPDGKPAPAPGVPGPSDKMPHEDKTSPGAPKPDGKPAPAPGVLGPSDKMPREDKTLPGAPKPDGKPAPVPGVPRPSDKMPKSGSKILPVPQVVIDEVTPLADGKSQDIDFSLNLPKGVRLERLDLDGREVAVPADGHFKLRLPIGPHEIHIEYGSISSDLHGEATQQLLVDADQVKVIKPKTRIAPPVKVPEADAPVPLKPRNENPAGNLKNIS